MTGRLVPPGDHEAMAAALDELGDGELNQRTGAAARRSFERRFDLGVRAAEIVDGLLAGWPDPDHDPNRSPERQQTSAPEPQ